MYFYYYILGIVLIPGILFSIYAQLKININFSKYSSIYSSSGIKANEIVKRILNQAGLYNIQVVEIGGEALNNYYDQKGGIIGLSHAVFSSSSIAALGIACHEVGHALQYADNYTPIKIRNAIIPTCNVVSTILWPIIFIGLFLNFASADSILGSILINCGIIFFGISILINLLTLPTEYNASHRAIELLNDTGALNIEELEGAKKVLISAGLTYVAALIVSILNLLRFLLAFRRRD